MTTDEAALRRQQQLKRVVIPLLVAVLFAVLFWPAKPSPSHTASHTSTSVPVSKARANATEVTAGPRWPRLHLDRITAENPFLPPQTPSETETASSDSPDERASESGVPSESAASADPAQAVLPWWQLARDVSGLATRLRDAAPEHATSSSEGAADDEAEAPLAGQGPRTDGQDGDKDQLVISLDGPAHDAAAETRDHTSVGRLKAIIHSQQGRIALLEGNRLIREGDRLGEGYQVVQITPDQILLQPLEPLLQPLEP